MTAYYVDDRNVSFYCAVSNDELDVTLLGTVFLDVDGVNSATPPVVLTCEDTVEDFDDEDGVCMLSFSDNPSGGWTLSFQQKNGATWGADQSQLEVDSSENSVEWRVHAARSGQSLYSDPFIRVIKGHSSGH
jgi:hypothetical protein